MIIRGQLADYVPAVGHNLFALIDDDTGALYVKNDTMFLALRSHRLFDLSTATKPDKRGKVSSLILQVDLTRVIDLKEFFLDTGALTISDQHTEKYSNQGVYQILRNPLDKLNLVLLVLANGLRSQTGNFWVANAVQPQNLGTAKDMVLMARDIDELSKKVITVVEEIKGIPEDLDLRWASLLDYRRLCLFGGGIYESIAQISGVEADTVKDVLEGLASVIVDVTTDSLVAGVSNLDFQVPTIGTVSVRSQDNIWSSPEVTITPSTGLAAMIAAVLRDPTVKKKLPVTDMVQQYLTQMGSIEARTEAYAKELKARAFERTSKLEVERRAIEQANIDAEKQMVTLRRKILSLLYLDLEMDLNAVKKVVCRKERPDENDEKMFELAKEARISLNAVREALDNRMKELQIAEKEGTDWEIQQLREKAQYLEETWVEKGLVQSRMALVRGAKAKARRIVKRRIVCQEGREPHGGLNVETGKQEGQGAARGIPVQPPKTAKALERREERVKRKRGRPRKHPLGEEAQPKQG